MRLEAPRLAAFAVRRCGAMKRGGRVGHFPLTVGSHVRTVSHSAVPRLPKQHTRCDNAGMTGLRLALANLKPGTGKTTSAVWLAHVFAEFGNFGIQQVANRDIGILNKALLE